MEQHVIFSADENYSLPLKVAVYSYAQKNQNTDIHVLYSFLSEQTKHELELIASNFKNLIHFHEVDEKRFESFSTNIQYINKTTYYRYLIPELLADVSKALYLDADILVNRNLSDIFVTNLHGYYAAGVRDRFISNLDINDEIGYLQQVGMDHLISSYVNAGVLFLNLAKIRKDRLNQSFFENDALLRNKIKYQDQDVLNYSFNGCIVQLPEKMNWTSYDRSLGEKSLFSRLIHRYWKTPYIVHFTGPKKPWSDGGRGFWTKRYRKVMEQCLQFLSTMQ